MFLLQMATLAATNWHKPIPLIPCLSWSSATPAFTDGVLSGAIPWKVLATQYDGHTEYEADILRYMLKCPQVGQKIVRCDWKMKIPMKSYLCLY